jgi:GT2 family glycosyltransferase
MAFRRKAFELVGDFDERLDVGAAGCNGDSELWYRVLAEGWACHYEPTSVVYHYHRRDINGSKQQIYYYLRGDTAAHLIQFSKYSHWGNLRHLFLTLPKYYIKLFLCRLLKGFEPNYSTLLAEVLGCLPGVNFYLYRYSGKLMQSSSKSEGI